MLYYLPTQRKGKDGDKARVRDYPKERAGRRLKAARMVRGKFTPKPLR